MGSRGRAIVLAMLPVVVLGCDGLTVLPPATPLPAVITALIETDGLVVRPASPAAGVVAPEAIKASAEQLVGHPAAPPVFVELACTATGHSEVSPGPDCDSWAGALKPGQTVSAWVVTFPGVDGANGPPERAWTLFDAETGQFQKGDFGS